MAAESHKSGTKKRQLMDNSPAKAFRLNSLEERSAAGRSDFCPDCALIDFDKIFTMADAFFGKSGKGTYPTGFDVASLGQRINEPPTNGCDMCKFFWTQRSDIYVRHEGSPQGSNEYALKAYSILNVMEDIKVHNVPRILQDVQPACLMVVRPGKRRTFPPPAKRPPPLPKAELWQKPSALSYPRAILRAPTACESAEDELWGRLIPRSVDFAVLEEWLDTCKSRHAQTCQSSFHITESDGFKLVHCATQTVIPASSANKYAALSYVWGPRSTQESDSKSHCWPQVVHDAMIVTLRLNLDYLWVDQLCITQENEAQKQSQIAIMDKIYEGADITIIAAAGKDSSYGLPGVNGHLREPQPTVQIPGRLLVSSMHHPRKLIQSSVWWTRGWTYQEAVLSKRRLVFTLEQVYFECEAMTCYESVRLPSRLSHTEMRASPRSCMRSGLFSGRKEGQRVHHQKKVLYKSSYDAQQLWFYNLGTLHEHIGNYNLKHLSYPSDASNAFRGISSRLYTRLSQENSKFGENVPYLRFPDTSIYGMPTWCVGTGADDALSLFYGSLVGWFSGNQALVMSVPIRREALPSWSWLGWKVMICWDVFISYTVFTGRKQCLTGMKLITMNGTPLEDLTSCEAAKAICQHRDQIKPTIELVNPMILRPLCPGISGSPIPNRQPQGPDYKLVCSGGLCQIFFWTLFPDALADLLNLIMLNPAKLTVSSAWQSDRAAEDLSETQPLLDSGGNKWMFVYLLRVRSGDIGPHEPGTQFGLVLRDRLRGLERIGTFQEQIVRYVPNSTGRFELSNQGECKTHRKRLSGSIFVS